MNAQPVDHDLLARFVGGALDDTPDGPAVADLIATDPAWTEAHDRLVLALDAVAADLSAYAAVAEPMPDDVAARLDRVMAEAPRGGLTVVPDATGPATGDRAAAGDRAATDDRAAATDDRPAAGDQAATAHRPAAGHRHPATVRRRRVPAWLAPVTIAAGVIAFGGFWLNQAGGLGGNDAGDSAGGNTAGSGADTAAEAQPGAGGTVPQRQAVSGTQYDVDSARKGQVPPATAAERSSAEATPNTYVGPPVPPTLLRLTDPQALASCLDAIAAAHGVAITATTAVDYAYWQNEPALMVFFTDANGENWTWAAGADCGASGPDTLYEARVA